MKRGGRLVIHVAIAFLFALPLTADFEEIRESARLEIASFFARPIAVLRTAISDKVLRTADSNEALRTGAAQGTASDHDGSTPFILPPTHRILAEELALEALAADPVPVLEIRLSRQQMLIGAGWKQGLRRGQVVSANGRFLGFVDRIERSLARVRLPGHAQSRFGAIVRDTESPGAPSLQTVLLSGEGTEFVRASAGRMLTEASFGGTVWRPAGEEELIVGAVTRIQSTGEYAVRLVEAAIEDRVALADARSAAKLELTPESVFSAFPSEVLAAGDSAFAERSALLRGGRRDGIGPGDAVVRGGRLLGVIEVAGLRHCRMRTYRLDELVLQTRIDAEGESTRWTRLRRLATGPLVPARLWVDEVPEAAFALAESGAKVEIHRFLHREPRRRLLSRWGR